MKLFGATQIGIGCFGTLLSERVEVYTGDLRGSLMCNAICVLSVNPKERR